MLRHKSQIKSPVNHVLRYQSFDTQRASSSSFRRSNLNVVLIYRLSLRVGLDSEFLSVFGRRSQRNNDDDDEIKKN